MAMSHNFQDIKILKGNEDILKSRLKVHLIFLKLNRISHDTARMKNAMSHNFQGMQILRGNEDILKSRLKVHVILL